jgi:hypothetical protein
MRSGTSLGVVVVLIGVVAAVVTLPKQTLPAAEHISRAAKQMAKEDNKDGIRVDVVIEEVDLAASTITATAAIHVVPPHDNVGGQVFFTGTTDGHKDQATKFVHLPVMPQANLKERKPKAGMHAILRLDMLRQGSLVVVGIEEFTGTERIGVEWLDAPGSTDGK